MNKVLVGLLFIVFISNLSAQTILDSYIQEGIENNLQSLQLQADYNKALEALTEAKRMYGPTVDAVGNYTHTFRDGIPLEGSALGISDLINNSNMGSVKGGKLYIPAPDMYNAGIQLTQPVFIPELKYQAKINLASSEVAKASLEDFKVALAADISNAYYGYLYALSLKEIVLEGEKLAQKNLISTEKLITQQKATKDALYKAKSGVADVEKQLNDVNNLLSKSAQYFNFLLNRNLNEPIEKDDTLVFDNQKEYRVAFISDTLNNYKLGVLEKKQEVLETQHSLINSNHLPDISLSAFGGFQGNQVDFDNSRFKTANVQLSFKWNIFNSGVNKSKVRQVEWDQDKLASQYEMQKELLTLKEMQYSGDINTQLANYNAIKSNVQNAQVYYETVFKKYELGTASVLELTDAQSSLLTTEKDELSWYYELQQLTTAYLKETGKQITILQ